MRIKNRAGIWRSLAVCVGLLGVFFCGSKAFAVDAPDYRMQISPIKIGYERLVPGTEEKGDFELENTGTKRLDFEVYVSPYSIVNDNYEADYNKETVYTEISKWITVSPENGSLEPGEKLKIEYTIDVPSDAHGGGQNAVIMVQSNNDQQAGEGSAVQALGRLGYIIYSNVEGETTRTGNILENKIPSFLFNPPVKVSSLVENTGNVYTVATYKLQVFPLFSDEEVYTNEEEPAESVVYAGTKRYNEMTWEGAPQLGIFKVRQTVKIFDSESVEEKLVFLCPIWFLFIVLLIIFCAIFWIVSRVVRRKKEA